MGWLTEYQITQHRDQAQRNRLLGKSGAGDDFVANLLEEGEQNARDRRDHQDTDRQTQQLQNQIQKLEQSRETARRERVERRESRRDLKREQKKHKAILDDLWEHLNGIEQKCEELSHEALVEGNDRHALGERIYGQCLAYAAWREKKNTAYPGGDLGGEMQQRIGELLTGATRKLHLPEFFKLTCIAQSLQNTAIRVVHVFGLLAPRATILSNDVKADFKAILNKMDKIGQSPSLYWRSIVSDLRELPFILDQLENLKEHFSAVLRHADEASDAGLLSGGMVMSPYDALFETLPNQSMDIPILNEVVAIATEQTEWLDSTIARVRISLERAIRLCKSELNVQYDAIAACNNYWPAASVAIEGRRASVPWEDGMESIFKSFPSYVRCYDWRDVTDVPPVRGIDYIGAWTIYLVCLFLWLGVGNGVPFFAVLIIALFGCIFCISFLARRVAHFRLTKKAHRIKESMPLSVFVS